MENRDKENNLRRIKEIETLLSFKKSLVNGPVYSGLCKNVAELCFKDDLIQKGIFYLTESHASSLRYECSLICGRARLQDKEIGLNDKYTAFDIDLMSDQYAGLVRRIQKLPKEWVLVQITRAYDPSERWTSRLERSAVKSSAVHIVRFECGENFVEPCHVMIPAPESEDATSSLFDLLHEATHNSSSHTSDAPKILIQRRHEYGEKLKSVVREIVTGWFKEWSCLLVGNPCNRNIMQDNRKSVDDILKRYIDEKVNVSLLYHLVNGCIYLSKEYIENAVSAITKNQNLKTEMIEKIYSIRQNNPKAIFEKRHPIILILDEKLECVPWEMTSPLRRHPVCRLPSVHVVYALYEEHKNCIVNGHRIVDKSELGYYIINPDKTLDMTEKRMLEFLRKRFPTWKGVAGQEPTKQEFLEALTKHQVLLYCGHGNGTQYLRSNEINSLRVQAVPMLFGCSSVRGLDLGGRVNFSGLSHDYLLARCPCIVGMLWSVTTNDTDFISLSLLNSWLPGRPLDLKDFLYVEHISIECKCTSEPELLRALKAARDSALMYLNAAALVAYGIPVMVKK